VNELGLRVDVCTSEGLRQGVPALLALFKRLNLRATFFVAMGPDRSGMALLRVFRRRGFLEKMMRTGAVKMYGLKTMLSGTLLPAPMTGLAYPDILKQIVDEGHEAGIHGWDHVLWHDNLLKMSPDAIGRHLSRAVEAYQSIVGRPPACTAAPAWLATEQSLAIQDTLGFRFASDTRGRGPFFPKIAAGVLKTPQRPVTLPTMDEVLGRAGICESNYNDWLLARLNGRQVYTLHAEAEGRAYLRLAEELLRRASEKTRILPLGETSTAEAQACEIRHAEIPGRAGTVTIQQDPS
jgi:peptidoglycan/xylan/chitin deacetylase (PgdA/CDA1 family)